MKSKKIKRFEIENSKKIRLIYISLEIFRRYDTSKLKIGETLCVTSQFELPTNMTMKQACKVISYLSEKVEQENGLEPASVASVAEVSQILENYGFKKIPNCEKGHSHCVRNYVPFTKIPVSCKKEEGVADLITFAGKTCFKHSEMYSRYFDWFTEGVSLQEVADIYEKIGLPLENSINASR